MPATTTTVSTPVPDAARTPAALRRRGAPVITVVQTAHGPLTVMLLPHVSVTKREKFSEDGLNGILLPAGAGSVAVLARGGNVDAADADAMVSAVHWAK